MIDQGPEEAFFSGVMFQVCFFLTIASQLQYNLDPYKTPQEVLLSSRTCLRNRSIKSIEAKSQMMA